MTGKFSCNLELNTHYATTREICKAKVLYALVNTPSVVRFLEIPLDILNDIIQSKKVGQNHLFVKETA